MLALWRNLPKGVRRAVVIAIKAAATVGAFWLLLGHRIDAGGERLSIWRAIRDHVGELDARVFVPFIVAAALIKLTGIFASMVRWHLLLIGQGIRFNFGHVVGSFLIGRFLGTFTPSTVGLDAYKLYDAARFSGRVVEPAAATTVEKVMGQSGVFLSFLVALPLGYAIFGDAARLVVLLTVPVAVMVVGTLFLVVSRPSLLQALVRRLPSFGKKRVEDFVGQLAQALTAYRDRAGLLWAVGGLSFLVHFFTAVMYFFTALAVGAATAQFWEVTLASTIQIFATVMSPFTIAGEGVREVVQALLLAKRIGASESVLSGALGFWAAEALTLVGAFFLWGRGAHYKPARMQLAPAAVDPGAAAALSGTDGIVGARP